MLLLFGAGLVYSFFYPYPYQQEQVTAVPTLVVDQDSSSSSRALIRLLSAGPSLKIVQVSNNTDDIAQRLWQGDIMAMVVIPRNFHHDLLTGKAPTVQAAGHGGYLLAGSKALASASRAALTMGAVISLQKVQSMGVSPQQAFDGLQPLSLEARPLFNTEDGYGHSIVPAVMVIIIQQTLLIGVTLLLGRQAELGQRASGAPAYFGMLAAFFVVAFLNSCYFFLLATRFQNYASADHMASLLAFAALFSLCVAAFAMVLGGLFKTRERGLQVLLITSVPMLFMSGYSWPVEALPEALAYARWVLPTTSGIHGFVSISQLGASFGDVLWEAATLGVLAVAFVLIGLGLYRIKPEPL